MNDDHFKVQLDENPNGLPEAPGNDLWILISSVASSRIGVSKSDANSNSKPFPGSTIFTLKIDCCQHALLELQRDLTALGNDCSWHGRLACAILANLWPQRMASPRYGGA